MVVDSTHYGLQTPCKQIKANNIPDYAIMKKGKGLCEEINFWRGEMGRK